ncbi:hypothetical protein BAX94_09525 [Elizabethkingia meningoseptica]|uniref:Uncharacterized protein n=2 Tax=Weeksellaceae TaxID=2762318 RepID=A0A1V3U4L2_ELIME|nr:MULTISPECIES: hypothetical protein [Bacteroidota]AQX11346.1 hypothetical protein BBD35_02650 [Elizabethkingia meningoseptica]MBG0512692.1 hypothetical protein [Elizabethkingia meningoseptica]MDE5432166.1 hypothetical protein [Elizabethkingia meningoseptica]MDE5435294.1 hypothetical protein [Elizabethkingia meningoseptica]MDE5449695.1 hypothetical protein [Elizabethkingia meningoseptica]
MIRKKDLIKIEKELTILIKERLLTEFKNNKGKPVDQVDNIALLKTELDEENENRDKIIVASVYANARLFIRFMDDDSTSSENTQVKNNIPIEFSYNSDTDEFDIVINDVKFYENKLF